MGFLVNNNFGLFLSLICVLIISGYCVAVSRFAISTSRTTWVSPRLTSLKSSTAQTVRPQPQTRCLQTRSIHRCRRSTLSTAALSLRSRSLSWSLFNTGSSTTRPSDSDFPFPEFPPTTLKSCQDCGKVGGKITESQVCLEM